MIEVGGIYTIRFKTAMTFSCVTGPAHGSVLSDLQSHVYGMGTMSYPAGAVIQGVTITSIEHVGHQGLATYGLRWMHSIEPDVSTIIDVKVSAQIIDLFVEESAASRSQPTLHHGSGLNYSCGHPMTSSIYPLGVLWNELYCPDCTRKCIGSIESEE